MTVRRLPGLAVLACMSLAGRPTAEAASTSGRPNILLIVADDLGYADLGAYGGDIETPNIDSLAAQGLLLTSFHTAPLCAPTRAMLLSGNNSHVAGMARQSARGVAGLPLAGYESSLSDRIVPFPKLLQAAGYHTYTVGKWHLGDEAQNSPQAAGFRRSFNLLEGGGSHFDNTGIREGGSHYREGEDLVDYPNGRYSTTVYTEKLIQFLEEDRDDDRPFFAFVAYTSPHWPLQVPDDYLNLYAGRYDDGYDALRERRFASLKSAGIVPQGSELPPRNPEITPWGELTPDQRRVESRKMELYAAMVDNLDDHVGRLIDYLEERGLRENTLVVFMSDNGAAGEDFYDHGPPPITEHVRAHYDNAEEKMGTAASFVSYGPQWAEAGSAPFQKYKGYTREGGLVAPMILAGPGVAARGVIDSEYVTVMDLAPTFLEIAGAEYPADGSFAPMLGESLRAFLRGESDTVHGDDYVTVLSHRGRSYLRRGRLKIVTTNGPFDEADFELYDVVADPGETRDLSAAQPELFAELIDLWRVRRRELGIVLPEDL